MDTEAQKKVILPFLQRADEVGKVEPKVAYYCRMYAVEQGLALEQRSPQIDGVLGALLAKLEKDKPGINAGPGDQQYSENFAVNVFSRADRTDRAGKADKNTATTFYAASIFMEILRQWGELSPDLADMQRYAAWKAADIRKALREGRAPIAGPPSNAESTDLATLLDLPSITHGGAADEASMTSGRDEPVGAKPIPGAADAGPAAQSSASKPATSRFPPGSKVLFCSGSQGGCVKGTVAKVVSSGGSQGAEYMVALAQEIVRAKQDQLAPDLEPGQRVIYSAPDGSELGASVADLHASRWRPSYLIICDGSGEQMEVPDFALRALPEPRSALMPRTSTPPSIAAPSPSESAPIHDAHVPDGGSPASSSTQPPTPPPPREVPGHTPPPGAVGPSSVYPQPPAPPPSQAPFAASRPLPTPGPPAQATSIPAPSHLGYPPSAASAPVARPQTGFKPDLNAITEAHKLAKYAASSLGFEDVPSAVKYLTDALTLLTQPARK